MNMKNISLLSLLFVSAVVQSQESSVFSSEEVAEVLGQYNCMVDFTKSDEVQMLKAALLHSGECLANFEKICTTCQKNNDCDRSIEFKQAFEESMSAEIKVNEAIQNIDKNGKFYADIAMRMIAINQIR